MRKHASQLLAQTQGVDQLAIAFNVGALEVIEQLAAAGNHHQQTAAGMEILLVGLEVLGEAVDTGRQKSNLDCGRSGVAISALVLLNDFLLIDFSHFSNQIKSQNKRCRC